MHIKEEPLWAQEGALACWTFANHQDTMLDFANHQASKLEFKNPQFGLISVKLIPTPNRVEPEPSCRVESVIPL